MANINGSIYTDGVISTLDDSNSYFAVALLDSSGSNILATSAIMSTNDGDREYCINGKITWDNVNKRIEISSLNFTDTKSLLEEGETGSATQFAFYRFDGALTPSGTPSEAYEESGISYYWPDYNATKVNIFSGELTNSITVNPNNNFKFNTITVNFSEADV